ncbi:uncharacterized protein F5891DRAFT_1130377 [Suillus fuscotomentosus]|uniref:Uncharacterized protein n=1 Tax=Suillus fuscotomentosus TaxID=1912939 RepID=A0AAD4DXZ1_9AGAM|nr:uncharacterized protein F5891DRAFT_1130377 [Suillus fuscotomentosus]KAG1896154.1 hypothetical protein F5891DRAFT_1130377 [Suillus fuscotomentosus]
MNHMEPVPQKTLWNNLKELNLKRAAQECFGASRDTKEQFERTDRQIIQELQKHIHTTHYGIGLTTLLKVRKTMGLQRIHQQCHTVETIRDAMLDLCATYPNAGACEMVSLLYHEREMSVARRVVTEYFALYEPELVCQCKACRLRRRRFWAAGMNDLFTVDQHDKWLRFSLGLHTGIEPFSGRIMWIRVWHSNRNLQLILSYYLNTIEVLGYMPMYHDKALHGTLQHRWMRTKKNVMPEIARSQLRRWFTPGFENLLDHGVNSGWYDSNNTLQVMVFRWVFIPWLQQELDAYQDRINNTAKQHDHNKILPHGVPNLIYHSAEDFGALDFKIQIEPKALDFPSHCMFDLVPEGFSKCIQHCYNDLGRPVITRQSVWDTYRLLLDALQLADKLPSEIQLQDDEDEDFVPLLDDYQDLPSCEDPNGTYYMGGVGGGLGLDTEHCRQLDVLSHSDELDITTWIDESLVGLDHTGLVVWEFSDCESNDEMVDGW